MKRLINWRLLLPLLFIFSLSTFMVPGFVTKSMAQGPAAAAAAEGAAAGAATAAGITTGTIIAAVVVTAAAIAAAIVAAGPEPEGVAISPGQLAAQEALRTFEDDLTEVEQTAVTGLIMELTSEELGTFSAAAPDVLGQSYGGVSADDALSGLTINDVNVVLRELGVAGVLTDKQQKLHKYLAGLKEKKPDSFNNLISTLQSISARNDQDALDSLGVLTKTVTSEKAVGAVVDILETAKNYYQYTVLTLLTAQHPGVVFTTVHHGGGVYTTVKHYPTVKH